MNKKKSKAKSKSTRKLPKLQQGSYIDNELFTPQVNDPTLSAGSGKVSQGNYGGSMDLNSATGGVAAGANLATGIIQGLEDNPYNAQYGSQASAEGQAAASLGGPMASAGASVLGMVGTGLDQGFGLQDYNEYGVDESRSIDTTAHGEVSTGSAYAQAMGGFDQMGELTKNVEEGNWDNVVIDLLGGSAFTAQKNYNEEQDEAKRRQRAAEQRIQQQKLDQVNQGIPDYASTFKAKFGGRLPKKQTGGITQDPNKLQDILESFQSAINVHSKDTANYENLGMQKYPKTRYAGYNPEGHRVVADTINDGIPVDYYMSFKSKTGGPNKKFPVFNENILQDAYPGKEITDPNQRDIWQFKMGGNMREDVSNQIDPGKNPILRRYGGQSHQGPDEGVEVDQQGNPSSLTGKAPVALTEKGEVNYNGYIFSDSIQYKK